MIESDPGVQKNINPSYSCFKKLNKSKGGPLAKKSEVMQGGSPLKPPTAPHFFTGTALTNVIHSAWGYPV